MEGDQGVHADTGYLGLDNNKLPILYGCDGGLFKPKNTEATSGQGLPPIVDSTHYKLLTLPEPM